MRVEALVSRKAVTVGPDASIRSCAELMAKEAIGLLVILGKDDGNRPSGVVSERDIVRAVSKSVDMSSRVETIATKKVVSVPRSAPLSAALSLMIERHIRHLVVMGEDGVLYGVLSIRDILREKRLLEDLVESEGVESSGTD